MDLILLERIKGLGEIGETVKVKPGYGRNFLLPKAKALVATTANRAVFETRKAELMKASAAQLSAAQARGAKLAGVSVTVRALSSDEGRLYGSVGPGEISRALATRGLEVERSEIDLLDGPIRNTGTSKVQIRLHHDLVTEITVVVEAEKG
jgi:large subunit ribosomal protein L9